LFSPCIDAEEIEERAALVEFGAGVPRKWAEGYVALCAMRSPPGFTLQRWQQIVDGVGEFIDRWAVKACECGWSDLEVFGCYDTRPDRRFDAMGLVLLLDRRKIVGIDVDGADLEFQDGVRHRFRRKPLPPGTVPLWDLLTR
jgi:hypothetical protein